MSTLMMCTVDTTVKSVNDMTDFPWLSELPWLGWTGNSGLYTEYCLIQTKNWVLVFYACVTVPLFGRLWLNPAQPVADAMCSSRQGLWALFTPKFRVLNRMHTAADFKHQILPAPIHSPPSFQNFAFLLLSLEQSQQAHSFHQPLCLHDIVTTRSPTRDWHQCLSCSGCCDNAWITHKSPSIVILVFELLQRDDAV